MKNIIRLSLLIFITASIIISQSMPNETFRGYSKIKYVKTRVNDNPIISGNKIAQMVKSIGYNTFPKYISYPDGAPQHIPYEELNNPDLYKSVILDVYFLLFDDNPKNSWSGSIDVSLLGEGKSDWLEFRWTDSWIDKMIWPTDDERKQMKKDWKTKSIEYNIFSNKWVFMNIAEHKIQQSIRNYIQEYFDELNIYIKEYP